MISSEDPYCLYWKRHRLIWNLMKWLEWSDLIWSDLIHLLPDWVTELTWFIGTCQLGTGSLVSCLFDGLKAITEHPFCPSRDERSWGGGVWGLAAKITTREEATPLCEYWKCSEPATHSRTHTHIYKVWHTHASEQWYEDDLSGSLRRRSWSWLEAAFCRHAFEAGWIVYKIKTQEGKIQQYLAKLAGAETE